MSKLGAFDQSTLGGFVQSKLLARGEDVRGDIRLLEQYILLYSRSPCGRYSEPDCRIDFDTYTAWGFPANVFLKCGQVTGRPVWYVQNGVSTRWTFCAETMSSDVAKRAHFELIGAGSDPFSLSFPADVIQYAEFSEFRLYGGEPMTFYQYTSGPWATGATIWRTDTVPGLCDESGLTDYGCGLTEGAIRFKR